MACGSRGGVRGRAGGRCRTGGAGDRSRLRHRRRGCGSTGHCDRVDWRDCWDRPVAVAVRRPRRPVGVRSSGSLGPEVRLVCDALDAVQRLGQGVTEPESGIHERAGLQCRPIAASRGAAPSAERDDHECRGSSHGNRGERRSPPGSGWSPSARRSGRRPASPTPRFGATVGGCQLRVSGPGDRPLSGDYVRGAVCLFVEKLAEVCSSDSSTPVSRSVSTLARSASARSPSMYSSVWVPSEEAE